MKAPSPKRIPKILSIHGDQRQDDYFWLNNRDNHEVLEYLESENAYCKAQLAHTTELQDQIYEEITGRIKPNDDSTPYKENGFYYQSRYSEGYDHPVYYRRPEHKLGEWEVILDAQSHSESHDFYNLGSIEITPNNLIAAYCEDTVGRRLFTIRFKKLESHEHFEDVIHQASGSMAWADNQTLYYTVKDEETLRSFQIWKHVLGDSEDELIYEEKDEAFTTGVFLSKTARYIIIASHSTISSEYRMIDIKSTQPALQIFHPREPNHEYEINDGGEFFYILTNWEATNFRIMKCPKSNTRKEAWIECLPHSEDILYEDMEVTKDYIAVLSRSNGIPHIKIYDRQFNVLSQPEFKEEARMLYFVHNFEFDNQHIRYGYCSMTTPYSTFDYFPDEDSTVQRKMQEIRGGYHPTKYFSQRIQVQASDGSQIPVSLVYKKELFSKGKNPCLLYGYGSYGHSIDPYFSIARISLLDRGFVYAIAHIRGGQELGRNWYEDGKMLKKKNTFTDFIACGKALINQGYSAPDQLCAMGGSAGGLLMGVIVNEEPSLWKAIVSAVPFVDVVTTMLDESIPLTTGEFNEWGNPKEELYYNYIKSYSPYDNITHRPYPNILVTTGFHDSQVQYWEPAKWVAKLRDHNTSDSLIVFYTDMEAGHSGKIGRYNKHRETALEWAFLIDNTNK